MPWSRFSPSSMIFGTSPCGSYINVNVWSTSHLVGRTAASQNIFVGLVVFQREGKFLCLRSPKWECLRTFQVNDHWKMSLPAYNIHQAWSCSRLVIHKRWACWSPERFHIWWNISLISAYSYETRNLIWSWRLLRMQCE